MAYLVGLDIGTTHLKAALCDLDGHELAVAAADTQAVSERDGWAEYEPENLWLTVAGLVRQVAAKATDGEIVGIAATGMSEAGLLLDKNGAALHPIIAWYDTRTEPQAKWWKEHFDAKRMFAITGLEIEWIYSLNKMMWVQANRPDLFARAACWLCITDYVAYRLSGELTMDYSTASRTMAFDIRRKEWSRELLDAAGIPLSLMPTPVPSGTVIGRITEDAARATGLKQGVPVVAGGQDHVCAALAAGAIDQTTILNSWGTAEVLVVALAEHKPEDLLRQSGFQVGVHVLPDRYYIMGGIPFSGGVVEWLKRTLPGLDSYEQLFEIAAQSPAGARGLVFLPHLLGSECPIPDTGSMAALVGLRNHHGYSDMIRAILEGICYENKAALDAVESCLRLKVEKICTLGGGVRSSLWRQIKADVTGKQLVVPDINESGAKGAALLAGLALGVYRTAEDAIKRTYRVSYTVEPSAEEHEVYERIHRKVYRIMYERITPLNEGLRNLALSSE